MGAPAKGSAVLTNCAHLKKSVFSESVSVGEVSENMLVDPRKRTAGVDRAENFDEQDLVRVLQEWLGVGRRANSVVILRELEQRVVVRIVATGSGSIESHIL